MKEQKIERRNFLKYAAAATIASPFLSDSKISLAGRTNANGTKTAAQGQGRRTLRSQRPGGRTEKL